MKRKQRAEADGAEAAEASKSKFKKSRKIKDASKTVTKHGGWKAVAAGEDFHEGLDEDGFMGLEVLEAPTFFSAGKQSGAAVSHVKGGKKKKAEAASAEPDAAAAANGAAMDGGAAAGGNGGSAAATKPKKQKRGRAAATGSVASAAVPAAVLSQLELPASQEAPDAAHPSNHQPTADGAAVRDDVAAELRQKVLKHKERVATARAARDKKMEDVKEAAKAAAAVKGKFVVPEGLSRKEEKRMLATHKRQLHKLAMKHKKAKIAERRQKYKQRKKERDGEAGSGSDGEASADEDGAVDAAEGVAPADAEQLADISAWSTYGLHPSIQRALAVQGFSAPTPIQEASLMPAIQGRRDIIGAAQTGSGKTLAFGLPILQQLLADGGGAPGLPQRRRLPESDLRALILLPTRELALQVEQHLRAIARHCGIGTAAIVGGLSAVKQARVLSKRPAVVAATPGRLWDLMQEGTGASAHLTRLARLDFLVLDEADRMVQQGHFQELGNIIAYVTANRGTGATDAAAAGLRDAGEADGSGSDDGSVSDSDGSASEGGPDSGSDDEEASQSGSEEDGEEAGEAADAEGAAGAAAGTRRGCRPLQTFVFSATLTLPQALRKRLRKGGGGAGGGSSSLDSLMDRVPFGERPKIVDLTSNTAGGLATGLAEAHLRCDDRQRDELLYYLLVRHPGRTLVFVNAVSATRRLAALLGHLGLPAVALHASQQQRQRLKALDRFKREANGVLVATDVAARGLDVAGIRCVVHYQLPASADLYVHRSGRTARAAADGLAVALVTPGDARRYDALLKALDKEPPPEFPVEDGLLPACHARVALALKLDSIARSAAKKHADKKWMAGAAADLGIDVKDDEVASDGEITSGRKRRELLRRMKRAGREGENSEDVRLRQELARLLAEPLRAGFSQKYFTGGAAGAAALLPTARPPDGDSSPDEEPQTGEGMQSVVEIATKLYHSRVDAASGIAAKQTSAARRAKHDKRKAQLADSGGGGGSDGPKQQDGAAGGRKQEKKRKRAGGASLPQALGRDASGTEAVEALRQRLRAGK